MENAGREEVRGNIFSNPYRVAYEDTDVSRECVACIVSASRLREIVKGK